jgi:putative membrane protein
MFKPQGMSLSMIAMAAVLALSACHRGDQTATRDTSSPTASTSGSTSTTPTPPAPTTPSTDTSGSTASTSMPPTGATGTSGTGTSSSGSSNTGAANTSGTGSAATGPLAAADAQFVSKAAEGGLFEVEVAKLAADKATDPAVKSFAQMLVDDHTAANDKLKQIASSHSVPLPASIPADKKKEIDQLSKLSGAKFDQQFVKMVGITDHRHDIADFEKASKSAKSDDVKSFAESTLPTLKKHLDTAQKLPAKG